MKNTKLFETILFRCFILCVPMMAILQKLMKLKPYEFMYQCFKILTKKQFLFPIRDRNDLDER